MAENTTALVICVAAFIIIIGLAVIVLIQKRRERRQQEQGHLTEDFSPPILTVTLTTSNFSERPDVVTQCSRIGLEKTPSERSDIDVWELRQAQRRQYIIDNIVCKAVQSKLCNTLDLPHMSELSARPTVNSSPNQLTRHPNECDPDDSMHVIIDGEKLDIEAGSGEYIRRSKESLYTFETSTEITTEMSEIPAQLTALHNYTHRSCPICTEEYQEGDEVCWSRNDNCAHAFHLDCKVGYLMNTDECILCRSNFLKRNTSETEECESIKL
mmetsp:Transcript_20739/g.30637  ORF Transcript_20739/g.30637 Transcript_20739/m.30637 type:complete len:270 (-) Transcript_20739:71-880(-)